MSRSRAWCFTINNPSDEEKKLCNEIICTYIVLGNEVGANGTPHIQGYIEFKDAKSLKAVKKLLGGKAHLEARKGTPLQASDYCKKDKDFTERGKVCEQGKRNDLEEIADLVKTGGVKAIIEQRADAFIKYGKNIERLAELLVKPRSEKPTVTWLWGATGTGKTRFATDNNTANYYIWNCSSKWWNGYNQQERIVIDDYTWDGSDTGFRYLLRLLDRYSIQVETKGGMVHINSPQIFITCEFPPQSIFQQGNQLNQLLRRVDNVIEMTRGDVIYDDDIVINDDDIDIGDL